MLASSSVGSSVAGFISFIGVTRFTVSIANIEWVQLDGQYLNKLERNFVELEQ